MLSLPHSSTNMPAQRPARQYSAASQPANTPPELVDPSWILKAIVAVFAVAMACAYVLICVLFSLQQWQLVLHPSRTVTGDPSSLGLAYQQVRFFPDAAGQPQLDGWWIPSDVPSEPVALLLHDGEGSMSDALPVARALHDARLGVLLFDYRGFGRSSGQHPTEKLMEQDAEAALRWLAETQHAKPSETVLFGDRLGAALAVHLAVQHSDIAGIILQQGDGDFASRAREDKRARMVPFRLLFHEDFALADPLHSLKTPKLLISFTNGVSPVDAQRAADPKMTYEIAKASDKAAVHAALRRFLDTYLTQPVPALTPAK